MSLPMRERTVHEGARLAADGAGEFEGYASLFHVADLAGDAVEPGAFAASLLAKGAGGVRMLWQHDPAQPVGRWLSLVEDARGLRVRGRLNPGVARAREAMALLRDGGLDGLSIGYRVERARNERATGLRRLDRVDLWEISLVTFPMQPGARVAGPAGVPPPSSPEDARLAAAIRRATARMRS